MSDSSSVASEWNNNAVDWSSCIKGGLDVINEQFGIPYFLDKLGITNGLEVLDAGCGEGRSSRHLASRGARVAGVDVSPEMIAQAHAKESDAHQEITYHLGSCTDLNFFEDGKFDLVTSFMALMDTPIYQG